MGASGNLQLFGTIGSITIFVFCSIAHYNIEEDLERYLREKGQIEASILRAESELDGQSPAALSDIIIEHQACPVNELEKIEEQAEKIYLETIAEKQMDETLNDESLVKSESENPENSENVENSELPDHPGAVKMYIREFQKKSPGTEKINNIPGKHDYSEIKNWDLEYQERLSKLKYVCKTNEVIKSEEYQKRHHSKALFDKWDAVEKSGNHSLGSDQPWLYINDDKRVAFCETAEPGVTSWPEMMIQGYHHELDGAEISKIVENDLSAALKKSYPDASDNYIKKAPFGDRYQPLTRRKREEELESHNFFLNQHSMEKRKEILESHKKSNGYFKFLVVRNPLERLLIIYKLHSSKRMRMPDGLENGKIMGKKNGKEDVSNEMSRANFFFFLRYITLRKPDYFTAHQWRVWRTFEHLCHVCAIDWDFIAKEETIKEDSERIIREMDMPEGTHLKGYPEFADTQVDQEEMAWYFHGVNKGLLEDVYETYKLDFQLFGYAIPQEIWNNAYNW